MTKNQKSLSCMNVPEDKENLKFWKFVVIVFVGSILFTIVLNSVNGADYLLDGLIDYWDFGSSAKGNFSGNTFTFQGTPVNIGHAYDLDAGDALVNNTINLPAGTGNVSFYIRFMLKDTGSAYYSIFGRTPVSSIPFPYDLIWINAAPDNLAWAVGNGTAYSSQSYNRPLVNNNISLIIVKTGNFTYDWYIDGDFKQTSTHSVMPVDSLANSLRIGARADGLNTNMIVYAFGIWNKTLNSSNIIALNASGDEPNYNNFLSSSAIPLGYYVNITNLSGSVTNSSINVSWTASSNATFLNLTLKRDGYLIFNTTNLTEAKGFSYTDYNLNASTLYTYLLNISYNTSVYSNWTLSFSTSENQAQVTNQDLNNTLAAQLIYIRKISTAVEMIPLAILYAVFMVLGFYMIRNGSMFTGWLLYFISIGFDFLFAGLLYEQYQDRLVAGITGQLVWIFFLWFIVWIAAKLIGVLLLQTRIKVYKG